MTPTRIRESNGKKSENDGRNDFDNDYSRIIMSSALRRLQDKTQVFPLEKEDFVRTRLTHSLEVSYFGENIGKSLEKELIEKKDFLDEEFRGCIPKILATAGLVHDLGNPPFGHYGEECIKNYFKEFFSSKKEDFLAKRLKADLELFDGNVQTFRILTKLQFLGKEGGFNLTYPTLATIIKYPYSSQDIIDSNLEKKKIGYYYSEEDIFNKIAEKIMPHLKGKRYPLTYLLEAADDIAYCIADIEDGTQKNLIRFSDIKDRIFKYLDKNEQNDLINKFEEIDALQQLIEVEKEKLKVQNLKIFLQGKMVSEVVKTFIDNIEKIFEGSFNGEILDNCSVKEIKEELKNLTVDKIFSSKEIIETEIMGHKVLKTLLQHFIEAEIDIYNNGKGATKQSQKLESLISNNYKYICEEIENKKSKKNFGKEEIYNRLKLCVDFISGMTDSYALDLFKKINGFTF